MPSAKQYSEAYLVVLAQSRDVNAFTAGCLSNSYNAWELR